MSDKMTFKFDTDVFNRFVHEWGTEMTQKATKKVLEETADDLLERAAELTPVRTGALKAGWKTMKRNFSGWNPHLLLGNTKWYAHLLEFGTVKMRARPMLTTAFRELQVSGGMARRLKRELIRAARKRGARG